MKSTLASFAALAMASLCYAEPPAPRVPPVGIEPTTTLTARTLTPRVGEKVTYLGANVAPVTPVLAHQLKLPAGVGLVVESVDPQSPADLAGIKPHDVLHKLGDQLLVNPPQLTALIRAAKMDEAAAFQAIREGAPIALTAKLIAKETSPEFIIFSAGPDLDEQKMTFQPAQIRAMAAERMILQNLNLQQTTDWADADHLISVVRQNGVTLSATIRDAKTGKSLFQGPAMTPEERKAIAPDLLKKLEQAEQIHQPNVEPIRFWEGGGLGGGLIQAQAVGARGRVLTWSDADHLFILRAMGPANRPTPTYLLALSKKDGKTVFDGPVMTDEQKQGLPAAIAGSFKSILVQPQSLKEFGGK